MRYKRKKRFICKIRKKFGEKLFLKILEKTKKNS